jgi:thiamine biosynthesis lipoprotein
MMIAVDVPAALPTVAWQDWSCLVRLVVTDAEALQPAAAELAALMQQVELAASRFRPDSELSRVNARAGRPMPISRLLTRLVAAALEAAERTGGALDPTLGARLAQLGYDRDIALLAGTSVAEPAASDSRCSGVWQAVRLDAERGLLTVPASTALDLGATAKAQTADWAAAEIAGRHGCSVLVELGGDLAVAGDKNDWQVLVAERAGEPGQQISLHSGGVATSTSTVRRWQVAGRTVHHLLDPATGRPADGPWRTVTVAAGSALRANTCSTAAIVLGAGAADWLAEQQVAARLVDQAGAVTTVGGWPC